MIVLAHGLGGRSDLPIPLWMALYGASAALLISFFALAAFWRKPRFGSEEGGVVLPQWFERMVGTKLASGLLRTVGAFLWLATILVGFFGADNSSSNPAPYWFYIWFWVGLVPASMIFGPVWRRLNPLRTLSLVALRFIHGDEAEMETKPWPRGLGYWPAVAGLLSFVWLELVFDDADRPLVVAGFLILYSIGQLIGSLTYGMSWYEKGDGFEVYSTLIGRLSPFSKRADGRIVMRNPMRGLARLSQEAAQVPVIAVILGSTAFDGITRTQLWSDWSDRTSGFWYLLLGTCGLAAAIGIVALTYSGAMRQTVRFATLDRRFQRLAGAFIHSLIPIAIGYTIAHYFSLLVFEGQAGYILASDPLDKGMNLFGTAGMRINFRLISPQAIALIQTGAIVFGHITGVVAAHDRAMELFPERFKTKAQYSLLAVMVLFTVSGIALLVGA